MSAAYSVPRGTRLMFRAKLPATNFVYPLDETCANLALARRRVTIGGDLIVLEEGVDTARFVEAGTENKASSPGRGCWSRRLSRYITETR